MTNQDKIFLGVFFVVILTCIVSLYNIITGPRKVTIDSKHFVCTETQPIGIEAECVAYRKVFVNSSTEFVWGRIFSVYGEMDNPNWLIPSLITSLKRGEQFSLTSGNQDWSYLNVRDFVVAVDLLRQYSDSKNQIVNIGNPVTIRILEVAEYVAKELGCLDRKSTRLNSSHT